MSGGVSRASSNGETWARMTDDVDVPISRRTRARGKRTAEAASLQTSKASKSSKRLKSDLNTQVAELADRVGSLTQQLNTTQAELAYTQGRLKTLEEAMPMASLSSRSTMPTSKTPMPMTSPSLRASVASGSGSGNTSAAEIPFQISLAAAAVLPYFKAAAILQKHYPEFGFLPSSPIASHSHSHQVAPHAMRAAAPGLGAIANESVDVQLSSRDAVLTDSSGSGSGPLSAAATGAQRSRSPQFSDLDSQSDSQSDSQGIVRGEIASEDEPIRSESGVHKASKTQ